jgi:stage III sporulation protein AB
MKLLGAVFILLTTTYIGFSIAKKFSDRPKQIRHLKYALQTLEAEIMYGHVPLKEASFLLSKQVPNPIALIFSEFGRQLDKNFVHVKEAWEGAISECRPETALKEQEIEILKQFGATLGQHDKEQQQKQIRLTLTHLEREESDAKDIQIRYEKMVKSLGVLSGLLLIVLLM